MCGIAGIISSNAIEKIELRMNRMLSIMNHRGPDAEGKLIFSNRFALGQKRLSIIDTDSRANQPMKSNNNVIVYNGEVYNYIEIKNKLLCPFKTESDTEAILMGIELKGIEWTLNKCNGMFAFSYYDSQKKVLYVARDRMGIKPLYYYAQNGCFIFASEIKGILESGLVEAKLNENAIDEYLGNRYIRAPYTFFKDIFQVLPGHYLSVDMNGIVNDKEYWKLPDKFNFDTNYNEDDILDEFGEQVKDAIERRMISDVPIGTYLSGGVDSSLITAIAAMKKQDPLDTFSIGFEEQNEFKYSQIVSEKYGTHHHEIRMTKNSYYGMLQEVISYKDAPLGVPNEISLARMSKELKKYITVVLSGEGADELMGGYGRIFRSAYDYHNHRGLGNTFYDYFIKCYEYVPRAFRDKYVKTDKSLRETFDARIRTEFECSTDEESIFRFFHNYHVKGLLQRCDATTMLASVEARVPFLDHKLIEFVYNNVPYELKLHWRLPSDEIIASKQLAIDYSEILDIPKYLLKQYSYRYLPKEIIERKKVGFPVPLDLWYIEILPQAKSLLEEACWIDRDQIDEITNECKQIYRGAQIMWMLMNIEVFRKMYFDKEWRY